MLRLLSIELHKLKYNKSAKVISIVYFILITLANPKHIIKFFIAYAFSIIPFMVVNGYLTSLPVVLYEAGQQLDFRIYTIPIEDFFYSMLMLGSNISLYEFFKSRNQ